MKIIGIILIAVGLGLIILTTVRLLTEGGITASVTWPSHGIAVH